MSFTRSSRVSDSVTEAIESAVPRCDMRPLGRVMVTGARGFLGRRVLAVLDGRPGVDGVLAAGREEANLSTAVAPNLEYWPLELTTDIRLPAGVRTVIHVAGEKRDPARMQAVNVAGARRLADAAGAAGVARLVHVSSVGVYGAPPGSGAVDESFVHAPTDPYERSKAAGEVQVREACALAGIEWVIVRPSNVIGLMPGGGMPLRGLILAIGRGLFTWFGPAGQPWLNYVHVDDAAAAIVDAAASAPAGEAYNVNCPTRLESAVQWIAEELAVPYPRRRVPRWLGRAAAELGTLAGAASGRSLPFDRTRFLEMTNDTMFDASKLPRVTGFAYPIGAEAMLRSLARAYRPEAVR